ncbi:MAG: 1,2-phenylacetyl-CoA epoxidase subunit PaaE [Gammaproteobacteria bacterium]
MKHFHDLTIADIYQETPDSLCVQFDVPKDLADEFRFVQGQHLPVRADIDGESIRRTYSICSAAGENLLRIGVRIQPGGRFSGYIARQLKKGDRLEVMPPIGHFQTPLKADHEKTYMAFAAGSGITPILSILSTTLLQEPRSRFLLFYGNRTHESTMFLEELHALKNKYPNRLSLHFLFSQEAQEFEIFNGRLDEQKVSELFRTVAAGYSPDEVYICGPGTMIDTVRKTLCDLGLDESRIHTEHFVVDSQQPAAEKKPEQSQQVDSDDETQVTVILDGHRKQFDMQMDDLTVLDAARDNGLELPYSCEGGVCSTCRTHVREGEVEMEVNFALEDWEVEQGYVLACQSRPLTKTLILDYDKT